MYLSVYRIFSFSNGTFILEPEAHGGEAVLNPLENKIALICS